MRRLITLLLIGLLTGSIVSAQDVQYIYCGGLSEADCQLLNNAVTNLPNIHSAQLDLTLQYWQSNQENPIEFMSLKGALNGTLSAENFQSPAGYAVFLSNLNADLTIHVPPSLEAVMPNGGLDHPIDMHLILKDGILYIDLDSLQTVLNDASLPAWGCYDLKPSLTARINRANDTSNSTAYEPVLTGFDLQQLSRTVGVEVTQKYAVVTRSEENGLVTFETRLDLPGLYADPVYQEALRHQIENAKEFAGWRISKVTDQHLGRLVQAAAIMFPEPILLYRYTVDLKQGYIQSLSSWVTDEWYFSMKAAMQGQDVSTWSRSGLIFNVDATDFNQTAPVVVPAGARPFDKAALDKVEVLRGLIPITSGTQSSDLSDTCGT